MAGNYGGIEPDRASRLVIGVDIGGTKVSAGIMHPDGRLVDFVSSKIEGTRAVDVISSGISGLLATNGVRIDDVGAIVLGVPGVVKASDGVVLSCPNLQEIEGKEFVEAIGTRFPVEIYLENDVNLSALGEYCYGAGRGYRNFIVLYIGTGIGTGIIIEGKVLRGSHGWAGEIGHMIISEDGPVCGCGNRGCFETLASGSAIKRRASQSGFDPMSLKQMVESGDERAVRVLGESLRHLAIGIANMINIFDPEAILIGGGVAQLDSVLFDGLIPEVRRLMRPLYRDYVRIEPVELNYLAPIFGSLALCLDSESAPTRKVS